MHKPFTSILVVVSLLIALLGQALAYTATSCEMSKDSAGSHMKMMHTEDASKAHPEGMQHDKMKMHMSQNTSGHADNCCGADCACTTSACTYVTFVMFDNPTSFSILRVSEAVKSQDSDKPKAPFTSTFRPPPFWPNTGLLRLNFTSKFGQQCRPNFT
ncbi:hypothetical protein [Catenovulum sediminis]|uniref:DUF2946 domain-containing protein n=1 Tax=Catenovulum sediminis TaxID=1740262 RepID=A0ABV1RIL4_9ALTE|nr:hypothetical protein [Catenovulum sediminis]